MGDISPHFNRSEFACSCGCGFDTVDVELIRVLEQARSDYTRVHGKCKIIITGGNRCVSHNEKIQKEVNPSYVPFSSKSTHIKAIASDIKIYVKDKEKDDWVQVPAEVVFNYFSEKYPDKYGVGLYSNRTHIDIRPKRARW